jgi:hypothetical protein
LEVDSAHQGRWSLYSSRWPFVVAAVYSGVASGREDRLLGIHPVDHYSTLFEPLEHAVEELVSLEQSWGSLVVGEVVVDQVDMVDWVDSQWRWCSYALAFAWDAAWTWTRVFGYGMYGVMLKVVVGVVVGDVGFVGSCDASERNGTARGH